MCVCTTSRPHLTTAAQAWIISTDSASEEGSHTKDTQQSHCHHFHSAESDRSRNQLCIVSGVLCQVSCSVYTTAAQPAQMSYSHQLHKTSTWGFQVPIVRYQLDTSPTYSSNRNAVNRGLLGNVSIFSYRFTEQNCKNKFLHRVNT